MDPLTRKPAVPPGDLDEIRQTLFRPGADGDLPELVGQNVKFDVTALAAAGVVSGNDWPWGVTHDTILAGHLLASNHRHDLTSMAMEYLGVDLLPYERKLAEAVKECRRMVQAARVRQRNHGGAEPMSGWRIAEAGLPEMPSSKGEVWRADYWLPRAVANAFPDLYARGECRVVNMRREPALVDVRIDRGTKWGNPFVVGKDGTREEVIQKYRTWVRTQPELMTSLGELEGKTLGCHCAPLPCHGDVLAELVAKRRHGYRDVLRDYSNADSAAAAALWPALKARLERRGLWAIYLERRRLLPIARKMEADGVTLSRVKLVSIRAEFKAAAAVAEKTCTDIAAGFPDQHDNRFPFRQAGPYRLMLPKGGRNASLDRFCFEVLKLPKLKSTESGAPAMDKAVIDEWVDTLPPGPPLDFILALKAKRSRDTAVSYLDGYTRFWLPVEGFNDWFLLHPNLNVTGTDTLRWSSSSPNEQNISKKEDFNLRRCFGPGPGREWWSLDAKNIELRLPAYLAGETALIDLFERPDDPPYFGSVHMLNFHTVFPEVWNKELGSVCRDSKCCDGKAVDESRIANHCKKRFADTYYKWDKNGWFAKQYGAGPRKVDATYHKAGANALLDGRMPNLAKLNRETVAFAERHGYVETLPDRTVDPDRGYPLICGRGETGRVTPTLPLSYKIQGTAMWWTARATVRCQEALDSWGRKGFGGRIAMQVHDEIVFDLPKRADPREDPKRSNLGRVRELQRLMATGGEDLVPAIPTPVGAEYHPDNWAEGHTF